MVSFLRAAPPPSWRAQDRLTGCPRSNEGEVEQSSESHTTQQPCGKIGAEQLVGAAVQDD